MCGTAEFLAPEIVNYDDITVASDMWAVGHYHARNVNDDSVCNAISGRVITYILYLGFSPSRRH